MWKTKWNVKYFCVCMIRIFLVVGFGSLAVELDPHKATAKQTGRATRCFLIRIFFTEQSGTTVWITDALISSLGDGAGDQEAALGQDVCPTERWGKRAARVAKPCSPGCGVLRGCQKEVGMYVQINVLAPPPPPPPKCCVLSREENEKDHSLFGRILPVLVSWAAVIGVLRDSCCRCQAPWTCYLRCLALGESSPQAPWESGWIRGLHPDDQGSTGLQPWRVFWCDSKGSLWHRILSTRESM